MSGPACGQFVPEDIISPVSRYFRISYDVAVVQWITSCNKNRMPTRVITLWRVDVTSLTTSVSANAFLLDIMIILKAIKSHLKGHMINRILHSWSFYMKFMKLAEDSFHKFHMNEHSCKILYVDSGSSSLLI